MPILSGHTTTKEKHNLNLRPPSAAELALQLLARDFALHCRRFRSARGLTQTQLAEQMGIRNLKGKITVSRWESGKITPKKHHLIKFLNLQRKYDERK